MPSERVIDFYNCHSFAIIGMSRSQKSIGWSIYDQLVTDGKNVYAVNPGGGVYNGVEFYETLDMLPDAPEAVIVCMTPENTHEVLESVYESGAKYVWFQQGSYDEEVLAAAARLGLNPIKGCAMMYMPDAAFFHKLHRTINELFGKGYK